MESYYCAYVDIWGELSAGLFIGLRPLGPKIFLKETGKAVAFDV
jgi:hypothetical protein